MPILPEAPNALDGWPRQVVKAAFLRLTNAASERQAIAAIANIDQVGGIAGRQPDRFAAARTLIVDIKAAHSPIATAFHSDAGARLMRRDSDIADAVMIRMIARKGIVTAPVHDSFISPRANRQILLEAMQEAAEKAGSQGIRIREGDALCRKAESSWGSALVSDIYQILTRFLTYIWRRRGVFKALGVGVSGQNYTLSVRKASRAPSGPRIAAHASPTRYAKAYATLRGPHMPWRPTFY